MKKAFHGIEFLQAADLSARYRGILLLQSRYSRAHRLLGLNPRSADVFRALAVHGGQISRNALAELTGLSWHTVDAIVQKNIQSGLLSLDDAGVSMTRDGEAFLSRLHQETLDIAYGAQTGFSLDLRRAIWVLSGRRVPRQAATIRFPKIPR